jgi:hypothetical protein
LFLIILKLFKFLYIKIKYIKGLKMKTFTKISLVSLIASTFLATTASAGWVMINDDGTKVPYTADCCKVVKKVKKVRKVCRPKVCKKCDYSKIPDAQLYPLEEGERLAPARLGNCGRR